MDSVDRRVPYRSNAITVFLDGVMIGLYYAASGLSNVEVKLLRYMPR